MEEHEHRIDNVLPDRVDKRDLLFHESLNVLPESVDLRQYTDEIENQGRTGSCVANATVSALEMLTYREGNNVDLSRLFLYYNLREPYTKLKNVDKGSYLRDGFKFASKQGICLESTWKFNEAKIMDKPDKKSYAEAKDYVVTEYRRVKGFSYVVDAENYGITQMKTALAKGYPITISMSLGKTFYDLGRIHKLGNQHYKGQMNDSIGGHAMTCLHEDTKIPLLDGRELTMKELYEEYGDGEFEVYSVNKDQRIVSGKAHSVRKTGTARELLKLTLDTGETLRCTPDHRIMMRDGSFKEAGELIEQDSVMPLYRYVEDKELKGYEKVMQPDTCKYEYTHRAVVVHKDRPKGSVIHHVDFNKRNNCISNLRIMDWDDHTKLHSEQCQLLEEYSKSDRGRQKSRELMTALWADPVWKANRLKQNADNGKKVSNKLKKEGKLGFQRMTSEERSALSKKTHAEGKIDYTKLQTTEAKANRIAVYRHKFTHDEEYRVKVQDTARRNADKFNSKPKAEKDLVYAKRTYNRYHKDTYSTFEGYMEAKANGEVNHKITKIEKDGTGDVYDMTVDIHHNFATSAGVFVHNCVAYDDALGGFIVENSWGKEWGDNGFCLLSYDVIKKDCNDVWVCTKFSTPKSRELEEIRLAKVEKERLAQERQELILKKQREDAEKEDKKKQVIMAVFAALVLVGLMAMGV